MSAEFISLLSGAAAALGAASLWAVAVAMFESAGRHLRPISLNLLKSTIALVLLCVTLVFLGQLFTRIECRIVLLLLVSGALGFAIGDTALFKSLQDLGARRSLLFMILCPPLAALIAWVSLGEALELVEWVGILLTVSGVGWVITERVPGDENRPRGHILRGVIFGLVFALGQSLGSVLSRYAFTSSDVSTLWTAFLRVVAAVACLTVWESATGGSPARIVRIANSRRLWKWVLPATFLGTYAGVWLQQTALLHLRAGVAQTLLATSPVFALVVSRVRGEAVSVRAVLGALIALAGIVLLLVAPS